MSLLRMRSLHCDCVHCERVMNLVRMRSLHCERVMNLVRMRSLRCTAPCPRMRERVRVGSDSSEGGFLWKKIPNLKLSHTVLRYRPIRGDWCTGGWSHRWVCSGRSTSDGDFLGSLTGAYGALPVSPTSDYTVTLLLTISVQAKVLQN